LIRFAVISNKTARRIWGTNHRRGYLCRKGRRRRKGSHQEAGAINKPVRVGVGKERQGKIGLSSVLLMRITPPPFRHRKLAVNKSEGEVLISYTEQQSNSNSIALGKVAGHKYLEKEGKDQ